MIFIIIVGYQSLNFVDMLQVKDWTRATEQEKLLLHLPHIEKDVENDDNANEQVREEQQSALKQQKKKIRLRVTKKAQVVFGEEEIGN